MFTRALENTHVKFPLDVVPELNRSNPPCWNYPAGESEE